MKDTGNIELMAELLSKNVILMLESSVEYDIIETEYVP